MKGRRYGVLMVCPGCGAEVDPVIERETVAESLFAPKRREIAFLCPKDGCRTRWDVSIADVLHELRLST